MANGESRGDSLMEKQLVFQLGEGGSIPTSPLQLSFKPVKPELANAVFVKNHYAHRAVPISVAFGAFRSDGLQDIMGAISFGKPVGRGLCVGSMGEANAHRVYELNRLWLSDECPKYSESRFIGWALRQLKKSHPDWVLVSYADSAQEHTGVIYKATNWIYTGLSADRTDPIIDTEKHNRHQFVSGLPQKKRSRKHRYFYFFNPKDKGLLNYPIVEYGN